MPDKVLMNKNALAALKTELGEYKDALPVFEMKEQQLKEIVLTIEQNIERLTEEIEKTNNQIKNWVAVLAEENVDLPGMVKIEQVITEKKEIAGVSIDDFVDINFEHIEIDFFTAPLWVDAAVEIIREQTTRQIILDIEKKKYELLQEELAEARRMKNALKEVFIPETIKSIRKIEIYLGDVERLAIGCAKLVKKKKQEKQAIA